MNTVHLTDGLFKAILVGRTNVGKSSLFNLLSNKRISIAHETPGATRDCIQRVIHINHQPVTIVDSGGVNFSKKTVAIQQKINNSVFGYSKEKADLILFVVNAKEGLTAEDREIAQKLRCLKKPVVLVVNKADHQNQALFGADFHRLGFSIVIWTSATQARGISELIECIATFQVQSKNTQNRHLSILDLPDVSDTDTVRIAVLGKPNAGKSSFVNVIHAEEVVLTSEEAGTTVDAVDTALDYAGKRILLIDTAGIRRHRSISEVLEKMAVARSFCAIDRAEVSIFLIDATMGVTEQDQKIAGLILEKKRPCIIAVNKWDIRNDRFRDEASFKAELKFHLPFFAFAPIHFISAKTGRGVFEVIDRAIALHKEYRMEFPTSLINRHIEQAKEAHSPPAVGGTLVKFFFAVQLKAAPPTFVVACNRPNLVPSSYARYLKNYLRDALGIRHIPIHLFFRRKGDLKLNTSDHSI